MIDRPQILWHPEKDCYLGLTCSKCRAYLGVYEENLDPKTNKEDSSYICPVCNNKVIVKKCDIPKWWFKEEKI